MCHRRLRGKAFLLVSNPACSRRWVSVLAGLLPGTSPWAPHVAGSFVLVSEASAQCTSAERASLPTLFLAAHHSLVTCYAIHPLFIFFPALITT